MSENPTATPVALLLLLPLASACGEASPVPASAGAAPTEPRRAPGALPPGAVLHHVRGESPGDWFGCSVAALGDVNGDRIPDFAVGAHQNVNGGPRPAPDAPPGYACVYSGADGSRLYRVAGVGSKEIDGGDDHFGAALASLPDVDGDGARELAVGAYLYDGGDQIARSPDENTGAVLVYSGATGRLLKRLPGLRWGDRFGMALDTIADVDGDGRRDLLVGVEKADDPRPLRGKRINNEGSIEVLSTRDLELLSRAFGAGYNGHMGHDVAAVGDLDGDGLADYAGGAFKYSYAGLEREDRGRGAPGASGEPDFERGAAGVFSTRTGRRIRTWLGSRALDRFGSSVAVLSDVPGGAPARLAVGAVQSGLVGDYSGPGYVRLLRLADGAFLAEVGGDALGDQLGWSLANAGDRDGDGVDDLLAGAPASISVHPEERLGRPGRLVLYSGADLAPLAVLQGFEPDDQFGTCAADVGDLDGDGLSEVLVGAPQNTVGQTRAGYAVVVRGAFLARPDDPPDEL